MTLFKAGDSCRTGKWLSSPVSAVAAVTPKTRLLSRRSPRRSSRPKSFFAPGVDLSYPPFAGTDNGQKAGIDIDVCRCRC